MASESPLASIEELQETIGEYSNALVPLTGEDLDYLDSECFRRSDGKRVIEVLPPFRDTGLCRVGNTSFAGIIQLDGVRLMFSTKVRANLFHMLSYTRTLERSKSIFLDPEKPIEIQEGLAFPDFMGRLFLRELDTIFTRGLLKKHIRQEEDISYLKGKLVSKRQLVNDLNKAARFHCIYGDLTYDNLENKVMTKALGLLLRRIKHNKDVLGGLHRYELMLRSQVNPSGITYHHCGKIGLNRLNDYYREILGYSRLILEDAYIRSIRTGAGKALNFLVDMNQLYEDFVTQLFEDIITKEYLDMGIEKQRSYRTLDRDKYLTTRPDIILRSRQDDGHPLIIDAKYKRGESNADYYQAIAYSLSIRSCRRCCLIYPKTENVHREKLVVYRDKEEEFDEVEIHSRTIDILIDQDMSFDEYIDAAKRQARLILEELLV